MLPQNVLFALTGYIYVGDIDVGDKICWWQFYLFLISFRSLSKNEGSEVLLNTGTGWSGIGTSKNAQTGSQPSFKFHISSRSRGTFSMTLALWALKNILYGMTHIVWVISYNLYVIPRVSGVVRDRSRDLYQIVGSYHRIFGCKYQSAI